MKRTLLLVLLGLFWVSSSIFAQQRTITGKVTDDSSGAPISNVSISVKGSQSQAQTRSDGSFSIQASTGDVILLRYVGYEPKEVVVDASNILNVQLQVSTADIKEVVVTALGIKRESKSLGYTAQSVSSETLTANKQTNMVNALQGKVAGVTITSTGGAPGQGARIQVRGINSFSSDRDNSPLFVIDGVLMDNSTSTQGGGASRGMSNRSVDLNPDDIETINILRSGAATALYGLRGSNGVVVITTKSGKSGRINIDLQSTYGIENVNKLPEVQTTYTQGWLGVYDPTDFWPSFGPTVAEAKALDSTHPDKLFNHIKDAYGSGSQSRNTLNINGGNEKVTFHSSISQYNHNGILKPTDFKNYQARLNGTYKVSEKFSAGTSISVNNSGGNRYNAVRYVEQLMYWSPRHDVNDFREENGTMKAYGTTSNPRYVAETNKLEDNVLRMIGNANFSYKPVEWFNLSYRLGLDTYRDNREAYAAGFRGLEGERLVSDNGVSPATGRGFVRSYDQNFVSINSTLLATFSHKISDNFSTTLVLGQDLYDRTIKGSAVEASDLAIWNWYFLNNANVINYIGTSKEKYRLMGLFGDFTLNYKDYLYLNVTGRNDITSSLLAPNNSFFYPSASLSYILSDHLDLPSIISNAKLRMSYAKIGKDAAPYSTSLGFGTYGSLPTGYIGFTRPNLKGNPNLRPEFTDTYEAGFSLGFMQGKLDLDFNYYYAISKDQINSIPVTTTTGFGLASVNLGSLRNKGVEVTLTARPVRNQNFSWESSLNFSANRNKVISINPELASSEINVYSESGYLDSRVTMFVKPGKEFGILYGRAMKRYYSPDEIAAGLDKTDKIDQNRPILIGANGFPVLDAVANQKIMGKITPDWIAGFNNTFRYKNLSANILFDARVGQSSYNQTGNFMSAFGISKYTEDRNDYKVFEGKLADGSNNTKEVWLGQGKDPKHGVNYGDGYYRLNHRGISEYFVEDASFLKLRSASINYSLPGHLVSGSFIQGLTLGVTGNNLAVWTKFSGFDPENTTTNAGSSIEGFGGMTYPQVRSFLFTLNVKF